MNLEILQRALIPLPYALIGDQLLLLTSIFRAIKIGDEIELWLASGATIRLNAEETADLEQQLTRGIARAMTVQAAQIEVPKLIRKVH
jgi:hypothetical protein